MLTFRNILLFSSLFMIFSSSCDTSKRPNSEGIKEEMAAREVKKVTDVEIMIKGEQMGMILLDSVEKVFKKELLTAMQRNGVAGAIQYCNLNAYDLVSNFEDSLEVEVRRVSDKPRNPIDTLRLYEQEIFEAYAYDTDAATSQIQQLDDRNLILTRPIKITNAVCLNCHGAVGQQITKENYDLIKSLYPDDQATGYNLGELRGMWSLKIPVSTIVNQL